MRTWENTFFISSVWEISTAIHSSNGDFATSSKTTKAVIILVTEAMGTMASGLRSYSTSLVLRSIIKACTEASCNLVGSRVGTWAWATPVTHNDRAINK